MIARLVLLWGLARKDWQLFLADRQAVVLCFLVPILLASAFGAIFHRPEGDQPRLSLTLVDEANTDFSRGVLASLRENGDINLCIADLKGAKRRLENQSSQVVVILTPTFARGKSQPEVRILTHASEDYLARWAEGVLTEAYFKCLATDWLAPLGLKGVERPLHIERETLGGVESLHVHAYSHSFCGMTLQYLLFWGMDSGLLLLRERRRGLWRRVRAAPVTLGTLLAGKVLSTSLIALLQIALTFGFGYLVFGVSVTGSFTGFVVLAMAAALLSAATGLLVAALGCNEARARSLSIVAILSLSLLGGLWLPFTFLPAWVQRVSQGLPTTWAARGFEGVTWRGMNWSNAWPCAAILVAFSIAFIAIALWRLRWTEARLLSRGEI